MPSSLIYLVIFVMSGGKVQLLKVNEVTPPRSYGVYNAKPDPHPTNIAYTTPLLPNCSPKTDSFSREERRISCDVSYVKDLLLRSAHRVLSRLLQRKEKEFSLRRKKRRASEGDLDAPHVIHSLACSCSLVYS